MKMTSSCFACVSELKPSVQVKEQGKPTEIVLESQFRPAIGRTVIEVSLP